MLAKDKKEGYCYCCFLNKNIVFRIKILLLSDFCGHKQTLTLLFLLFAATFTAKLLSVRLSIPLSPSVSFIWRIFIDSWRRSAVFSSCYWWLWWWRCLVLVVNYLFPLCGLATGIELCCSCVVGILQLNVVSNEVYGFMIALFLGNTINDYENDDVKAMKCY